MSHFGPLRHGGWIVSVIFLWLAVRGVDWTEFLRVFLAVTAWKLVLLVGIYLSGFMMRGWRWRVLLGRGAVGAWLGLWTATGGVVIGYAANNLLPGRLGEVARAEAIARRCGVDRVTALASILVERVLDGLALVFLLFLGAWGRDLPPWADVVKWSGLGIFIGALAFLAGVGATGPWWRARIAGLVVTVQRPILRSCLNLATRGLEGVMLLWRDRWLPPVLFGASLLVWSIEGAMFWAGFWALGIPESARSAAFLLGIVNLGLLIPSSPGNLGVFQYFSVLGLQALGSSRTVALNYGLLLHACQYVPITLIGLLLFPSYSMTWRSPVKDGLAQGAGARAS